jgi:hypothetical protein
MWLRRVTCPAAPGNVGGRGYRLAMTDLSVNVHGTPGQSLGGDGARIYAARDRSRGAFIEQAVACALEHWLSRRPDRAGLHLFHDLGGFRDVAGHGFGPVSLGSTNIDHVILSGYQWLMVDAKGTGAGTLTTNAAGKGVLIQDDGSERPQPWLDNTKMHSASGVLVRLTGLQGWPVWAVPDATSLGPEVVKARAFRYRGTIANIGDVYRGSLDEVFPAPQPPADAAAVAALARYVIAPRPSPVNLADELRAMGLM